MLKQELDDGQMLRYFSAREKTEAKQFGSMLAVELMDWQKGKKAVHRKVLRESIPGLESKPDIAYCSHPNYAGENRKFQETIRDILDPVLSHQPIGTKFHH